MSDSVISAACKHWALGDASAKLIAARENSVYRIDAANGPAVLRLHRVGYRSIAEINSELLWMDMLAQNGINVPGPIQAPNGSYLFTLDGVVVSMLSWMDGIPLSKTVVSKEVYFELGQILARMHSLADAWQPPSSFTRPTWDLLGDEPSWGRFWENPLLNSEQSRDFQEFRAWARKAINDLQPSDFGLVHADLVPDNVLSDGKGLQLIDFDDGGFGYRLFDLATITHRSRRDDSSGDLAEAVVKGYSTDKDIDANTLMLFEALRACTYVGWNISRMNEPDGRQRNLRYVNDAETAIRKYYEKQ